MKKKIKAIIFDLGGVVMHGGYLDFLNHYCKKCLTPQGHKEVERLEHLVNLGRISENEFYRLIQKTFGVHLTAHRMHNLIVSKMKANKALVHLIPKLQKSKIVLFTNSIGNMALETLKARRVPTKKLFVKVFLSNIIHLAKPDKEAYEYVLKKLKVKPSEALLVDDRLENITPAQKLGMNGIVFKNTNQFNKALKKYQLI